MSLNTSEKLPRHIPDELKQRIEALHTTGHFGGTISQHRALLTIPLQRREFVSAILLMLLFLVAYIFMLEWVAAGWANILRWCLDLFDYNNVELGSFGFSVANHDFYTPYIQLSAAVPGNAQWDVAVYLTAGILVYSIMLPERYIPLAYLLRALAVILAISIAYFTLWPEHYPYNLAGYHALMMMAGMAFIALVPIVFALTYFIFDISIFKKIALTSAAMLYLGILIPLQYFAHVYLIHEFSLLYMPILFLMFGLMIDVFLLVAFYTWGMSWSGKTHPHTHKHSDTASFPTFDD